MDVNGNWGFGYSANATIPTLPDFEGTLDQILEKLAYDPKLADLYDTGKLSAFTWWYNGKIVDPDEIINAIASSTEDKFESTGYIGELA